MSGEQRDYSREGWPLLAVENEAKNGDIWQGSFHGWFVGIHVLVKEIFKIFILPWLL
jgi:hypothetical protein